MLKEFDDRANSDSHSQFVVDSGSGRGVCEAPCGFAAPAINQAFDDRSVAETLEGHVVESGSGQNASGIRSKGAAPVTIPGFDDQLSCVACHTHVVESEGGQRVGVAHSTVAALAPLIAEVREQWRRRQSWHRAEKSLTLQAKALCRRLAHEGDKAEADKIYKAALGKGEHEHARIALAAMLPLVEARDGIEKHRKAVEKRLAALAKQLPAAPFIDGVRGAGLGGLAAIIGETGDLSNYANPAKVWKRLGFAPYQGLSGSAWKRESWRPRSLSKDEWIENPFNGARYSVAQQIALSMFKAQWTGAARTESGEGEPSGFYGEVYAERRVRTAETHPEWTKAHANADALRVMMKRFLRDLWAAWNEAAAKRSV